MESVEPSLPDVEAVEAHAALNAAGLGDLIWGHASVRRLDDQGVVTKSSGWGFDEISSERLVHVGWDGRRLAGTGNVHIEMPIHLQVMQARPDVRSVVHTHAPAVSAFAALDVPLRAISHDGVPFAVELPRFEETGNLIQTTELGDALAACLGPHLAVVIPQHGMVTAGRSVEEAVMLAVLLERACAVYLSAAAAGGPTVWSSETEVREKMEIVWSDRQLRAGYAYLVRRGAGARVHDATDVEP